MQNIKPLQEPPQFQYGDAVYPEAHPARKDQQTLCCGQADPR